MKRSSVSRRAAISDLPKRVAVLVDSATNWGRQILTGIHHYMQKHGRWQMFVEPRGPAECQRLPPGWRGDGVIARVQSPAMVRHLEESGLPVVNVSAIHLPRQPFATVTSDMEQLARLAADYFLERGFRHFAYLSLMGLEYVVRQQTAFARSVNRHGFDCAVRQIPSHPDSQAPDWNLDLEQLGAWLLSLPKPLAILTWSGGREITLACQHTGLRVPDDVALLNAVDDFLCQIAEPSISGIEPSCEKIGHEAARLLAALMAGRKIPTRPVFFPPRRVITRQSTDTLAISDPVLVAALHIIRKEADQALKVADIAARAGVSRRVLERRFADILKRSPGEELRRQRLRRAVTLLEQTPLSISDVAERSGFGSPEYLTCVFRRKYRLSPLRYRREAAASG